MAKDIRDLTPEGSAAGGNIRPVLAYVAAARLARKGAKVPSSIAVTTVMNDGTPDEGISRFVEAISG